MISMNPISPKGGHLSANPQVQVLDALDRSVRLLERLIEQQQRLSGQIRDLQQLINGFTGGGSSFNAYQLDPFTAAYIGVLAPVIADQLRHAAQTEGMDINELMKGGIVLSRQLLDELAAYRSQREARDYLEEQMSLISDPWQGGAS